MNEKQKRIAAKVNKAFGAGLVFKKNGELSKYTKECIYMQLSPDACKIYPMQWHIKGKHKRLIDNTIYFTRILNAANYKFTNGNDSPKYGKDFEFIKISKQAVKFLQSLV